MDREIVRFVLAGLANTAASYLLYLLLLTVVSYAVSYTLAYAAGIGLSYLLNSLWVFRAPAGLRKALRWPVVCAAQYLLSAGLLLVAVDVFRIDPRLAPLPAVALTVPVTFLLSRMILRGRQGTPPAAAPEPGAARDGILVNGGLAVSGVILAVLLAEGALRLGGYAYLLGQDSRPPRDYFIADRENGYDIGPGRGTMIFDFKDSSHPIWSNEVGCFDRPYGGEEPFILLLGDSTAWGYKRLEETWGSVVERETGMRVLKCAVPGYGTKHEVLKGRKVTAALGRSPSLILVGHCANDHMDDHLHPYRTVVEGHLLQSRSITDAGSGEVCEKSVEQLRAELRLWEQYGVPYEPRYPVLMDIKRFLNRHSIVYRMAQPPLERLLREAPYGSRLTDVVMEPADKGDVFYRQLLYAQGGPLWLEEAWQRHFQNLRDLRRLAEENGAVLVVVLLPTREQVNERSRSGEFLANHDRLLAFLGQEGIPFIDLLGPLREVSSRALGRGAEKAPLYWRTDSHMGPVGDHLVGLHVAHRLIAETFVQIPDREDRLNRLDKAIEDCCANPPRGVGDGKEPL